MADTPQPTSTQRFSITARFKDPEVEMFKNELLDGINGLQTPISIGPGQALPNGMTPGQPVIDWSDGVTPVIRVWTGTQLI
jgi:hypothetical protein